MWRRTWQAGLATWRGSSILQLRNPWITYWGNDDTHWVWLRPGASVLQEKGRAFSRKATLVMEDLSTSHCHLSHTIAFHSCCLSEKRIAQYSAWSFIFIIVDVQVQEHAEATEPTGLFHSLVFKKLPLPFASSATKEGCSWMSRRDS